MTPSQSPEATRSEHNNDPFQGLIRVETDITIQGTTSIHVEHHSHALSWCVQPFGTSSREALRVLRPEDRVTISSSEGRVLFDGELHGVFYLLNPIHVYHDIRGQKAPQTGFVIYWAPKNIDPHTWLSFFESGNTVAVHRHVTALLPQDAKQSLDSTSARHPTD